MKAESQPTLSIPRMQRLTVADVMDALKNVPASAEIRFKDGGHLEAQTFSPYLEVEVAIGGNGKPVVKTWWE